MSWREVTPARRWIPEPGDEITGSFLGVRTRSGCYGRYQAVSVATDTETFYLSGVMIVDLVESIAPGTYIKVRYEGVEKSGDGEMRVYKLYVKEN